MTESISGENPPPKDRDQRDRMVWIDCEMTGLELGRDALVEVAVLVTDSDLNILGDGIDVVIKPPQEALEGMPDVVREMHTSSGLLTELDAGTTLLDAQEKVLAYVKEHVPTARKAPLAGNSVYVDRGFLNRDMPALDEYLHYRLVDVSSIKELVRRWFPRVYFNSPAKHGGHRALARAGRRLRNPRRRRADPARAHGCTRLRRAPGDAPSHLVRHRVVRTESS